MISKHYKNPVALVDNFQVPGDAGYGHEDSVMEKLLRWSTWPCSDLPKLRCFFPMTLSSEETGHRRGSVVPTSSETMAASLRKIGLSREHSLP